jgi:diguanylate cyclase (GGDEF)-like protein
MHKASSLAPSPFITESAEAHDLERQVVETCVHLCAIALEREERTAERERRASVDFLTGHANRNGFEAALAGISCNVPGSWALLLVDFDNVKVVNDSFGHAAGDALLQSASARLASAASPDRVFRLGGDEFGVLVQSAAALADLEAVAENLLRALSEPINCDGHTVVPKASVGGAVLSPKDRNAEGVRKNADLALYHAEETRKGGFVLYWHGLRSTIVRRRQATSLLDEALRENRVDAFYHPIVRLDTREIVGVEALCRVIAPGGEIIAASAFHEATNDHRLRLS